MGAGGTLENTHPALTLALSQGERGREKGTLQIECPLETIRCNFQKSAYNAPIVGTLPIPVP